MKKKILSFVLAICLIIPAMMFGGCGKNPPSEEWEDVKQFSCSSPYYMQKGSETFTRITIDFKGEMVDASITFNAFDFNIKTESKYYQAFAFADFNSTREWSISYQSKTYNGQESPWFDETSTYQYSNISFYILIRGTELQNNDIATLYYKGEAVCDL